VDLESSGIQLLSETAAYAMFTRDNLIALVERSGAGFGGAGSTGIMTEQGLGYLVWREGQAFVTGKGFELPASDEQVAAARKFSEDLQALLATR
jgi:hypothetical protein